MSSLLCMYVRMCQRIQVCRIDFSFRANYLYILETNTKHPLKNYKSITEIKQIGFLPFAQSNFYSFFLFQMRTHVTSYLFRILSNDIIKNKNLQLRKSIEISYLYGKFGYIRITETNTSKSFTN